MKDQKQYIKNKIGNSSRAILQLKNYQSQGSIKSFSSPGQIKNIQLKNKRQGELVANMIEFSNYICVPQWLWVHLIAIYKGGPAIERIYPTIYYNFIYKAKIDKNDVQFKIKNITKFQSKGKKKISQYLTNKQNSYLCYYKAPGKTSNWVHIKDTSIICSQVFTSQRNYIVCVPFNNQKQFLDKYNVFDTKTGKQMKQRLKNIGAQINIMHEGILTRVQVSQILTQDDIQVIWIDQEGNSNTLQIHIDQKLKRLNPSQIQNQKNINQLPGMKNIGNTCYINAVLQCLIRTPLFGSYLQKQNFQDKQGQLLLQAISKIYSLSKQNIQCINTKQFKQVFDKHCPFFQGTLQQDAQQFLICLLSRISEEIKSKLKQFGANELRQSQINQNVNKKVVKFFSGKTQTQTYCSKCNNKRSIKQPFFTYSISLPQIKDFEYSYYLITKRYQYFSIPIKYGITLQRKITSQNFIKEIAKIHKIKQQNLQLFTIFNNQLLSRLQPKTFQGQIYQQLNFNTKFVFYQVQSNESPTYYDYKRKQFDNKSVKIQVRQRIYSQKSQQYKIIYIPYIIQIQKHTTWRDVVSDIQKITDQLLYNQNNLVNSRSKQQKITNSYIGSRIKQSDISFKQKQYKEEAFYFSQFTKSKQRLSLGAHSQIQKQTLKYNIRLIKNDNKYQNTCALCKQDFVINRKSKSKTKCKNCYFQSQKPLFDDVNFRNIGDGIIIIIDWLIVPMLKNAVEDITYQQGIQKVQSRKQRLQDLFYDNLNKRQQIEMTCQKKQCGNINAIRIQKIAVFPNILLIHLKRFNFEEGRMIKLINNVEYPSQLVISEYQQKYQLYGVVVHYGSGLGGHYIGFVKVQQRWYKCDDSKVSLATPGQHVDSNAYLLFYKRVNFQPSLLCLQF